MAAGFFAKANLMASAYPAVSPMDAGVFFGGTGRLLAAQIIHIIWIAGQLPLQGPSLPSSLHPDAVFLCHR